MKNRIVKVLMERDGLTESEAIAQVKECKQHMMKFIEAGNYDAAEIVLEEDLGLELDYIFDLIF